MTRRLTGRSLVVSTCLLATLGAGCTPGSTPSPTPSTTSATAVATPSETAQEHEERLAYEAAEKSYRTFRGELYRLLRAGGSSSATPTMKATASGPYLKNFTEVLEAYRGQKTHSVGTEAIGYVHPGGFEPASLVLDACEDSRGVKDYSKSGKLEGRGEVRVVRVELRKIDGTWKLWDGQGKKAGSCEE